MILSISSNVRITLAPLLLMDGAFFGIAVVVGSSWENRTRGDVGEAGEIWDSASLSWRSMDRIRPGIRTHVSVLMFRLISSVLSFPSIGDSLTLCCPYRERKGGDREFENPRRVVLDPCRILETERKYVGWPVSAASIQYKMRYQNGHEKDEVT